MLQVGKFNKLKVVKTVDFGVYLDGGERRAKFYYHGSSFRNNHAVKAER